MRRENIHSQRVASPLHGAINLPPALAKANPSAFGPTKPSQGNAVSVLEERPRIHSDQQNIALPIF
jgi:hypothetical protein